MALARPSPWEVPTRSHNEGSIFRRKRNNRWAVSVSMPNGRRREAAAPWYDNTRAAAKELLARLLEERDAQLDVPRKLTTAAWLRGWLADVDVRPSTRRFYGYAVRQLPPELGATLLPRLGPAQLQRALDDLPVSPRTRNHIHAIWSTAFSTAVRQRKIVRSPMLGVERPKVPPHRATVLSIEQARILLDGSADDWYGPLWAVLLATGLRISEALGLTWDDFDGETLTVRSQLAFRDGWLLVPTKAARTLERIALPSFAVAALETHRARMVAARQPDWRYFGHIFVTSAGMPPHLKRVGDALRETCVRLDLPRIHPHELRHTSLTLLADAGVPEDVRQRRAGHSTTTMARRYTSHAELADRTAADALDRAIGGK